MDEQVQLDDNFNFDTPNGSTVNFDLIPLGVLGAHRDAQRRIVLHLPAPFQNITIRRGERLNRAKWKRVREAFEALGVKQAV